MFITSNLAMTLTGNGILQVLLALFILFFPGFMKDYANSKIYEYRYNYNTYNKFSINQSNYDDSRNVASLQIC